MSIPIKSTCRRPLARIARIQWQHALEPFMVRMRRVHFQTGTILEEHAQGMGEAAATCRREVGTDRGVEDAWDGVA